MSEIHSEDAGNAAQGDGLEQRRLAQFFRHGPFFRFAFCRIVDPFMKRKFKFRAADGFACSR
jgi:hypothetical protein